MEIGLFQLENLMVSRVQFYFLDLRESPVANPALATLLAQAIRVSASHVQEHLNKNQIGKDYPVVLLCEDGNVSSHVAHSLESAGFKNIYTVARGTSGLLSDS